MQYNAVQGSAGGYCVAQYHIPYIVSQCSTVWYDLSEFSYSIEQYSIVLVRYTIPYYTVQYSTVWYNTATVLYSTVQYSYITVYKPVTL